MIVKPELGPHGIYATPGGSYFAGESADGLIVVARSCILADAAAAATKAILAKPGSFRKALAFLQNLRGVHGAIIIRGEAIGVAGRLAPGLSFLIAGELHFVIVPSQICAITAGVSFSPAGAPGTL